ncbi:MAG TPA: ABC transporter permease, partial [Vicinamibacterales bacterium]|nr:ABC transporter permease [Vicinamibacterales bacterium]
MSDVRYAFRLLRKNAGFATIVVLTLALGIGANTVLFSIVNGVLLKPLSYPNPEQLVALHESKQNFPNGSISFPNFRDWRDRNHTFAAIAVLRGSGFAMTGRGEAEPLLAEMVSADFFSILGVQPVAGRLFRRGEDEIGAAPIVAISEGFWRRKLGASPSAIGQSLTLDGRDYTIVGVVPASFDLPLPNFRRSDVYAPIGLWSNSLLNNRSSGLGIHGIGRLKPGVTIDQARADMTAVTRGLTEEYPDANKGIGASIAPLAASIVGGIRPYLLVLLGAVLFVLLIACVNVSNLQLVRALARRREFAVRAALGARGSRVLRQLVTESVLLACIGGALGLALAMAGTRAALAALPTALPRAADIQVDARVLVFTFVISVLAGVLFGLAPAWRASRPDLQDALRDGGRGSTGDRHRTHGWLVIAETALAVVLLVGAGLMIRTLAHLWATDIGFQTADVVTFGASLAPSMNEATPDAIRAAHR